MKTRPLNPEEQTLALTTSIAAGYVIGNIDLLRRTTYYRHNLARQGNLFQEELVKFTNNGVWKRVPEEASRNAAMDQAFNLEQFMHNMLLTELGMDYLPQSQLSLFYEYMMAGFIKFKIPMIINQKGQFMLDRSAHENHKHEPQ